MRGERIALCCLPSAIILRGAMILSGSSAGKGLIPSSNDLWGHQMSTETTAREMALRAKRVAILATFLETIEDRTERKTIIMHMYEVRLISEIAAESLIEFFGLEAA